MTMGGMKIKDLGPFLFVIVLITLASAACNQPEPTSAPTSPAVPTATPSPVPTSEDEIAPGIMDNLSLGTLLRLPTAGNVDDQSVGRFLWVQVEDPSVILSDPYDRAPVFVAQQPGTYTFEMVVTDTTGIKTTSQAAPFVVGNDPPELRVISPGTGMVGGQVGIQFTLADSTSDLVDVRVEFSVDGGETFNTATSVAPLALGETQSEAIGADAISTAGEGKAHTFLWNSIEDLGTKSQVDVFIRLTPLDSEISVASGPFTYHSLLDGVVEACALPLGEWELSRRAWEALGTSIARCQNDLLADFESEMDILRLKSSELSIGEIATDTRSVDLTLLLEASLMLQQATSAAVPESIAQPYASIEYEVVTLEAYLSSLGDDAQVASIDLQNSLQKLQQTIQMISNVSKMLHDTTMAIIRKIG